MLSVIIIADDLTGALDSAAPFRAHGLRVSVALDMDGVAPALREDCDVVAINCDSRMLDPYDAMRRMADLWGIIAPYAPDIIFQKIDSRLKGHPAQESAALLAATGRVRALVCPAVPDMGRLIVDGAIMGAGVERTLPLSRHFPDNSAFDLRDAADAADLDAIADHIVARPGELLPVGARGLAQALARRLGNAAGSLDRIAVQGPLVIAIGSRDPQSRAQIGHLQAICPGLLNLPAPGGRIRQAVCADAAVILCHITDDGADAPQDQVAALFAANVAAIVRDRRPRTLLTSGGATAAALARALDIHRVRLIGEAAPAVPVTIAPEWNDMMFLTKSGSFGGINLLSALAADMELSASCASRLMA